MTSSQPGAASALLGFAALLLGFIVIGIPLQQHGLISGLWATEALAIALPAVVAIKASNLKIGPYLGLRRPTLRQLGIAALVSALNQPVVSLLTWVAHEGLPARLVEDFDAKQRMLEGVFAGQAVPMVITVAIAAPLGEELFFRGFALPALQKSWGPVVAVLVSAALFSLLHLDPVGFVGLMEIGAMLALLRLWSRSLWPAVLAHAVNNGIAGGAFLLGFENPQTPPPPWVLALGAVLLLAGLALAVRLLRRHPEPGAEEVPAPGRSVAWALSAVWLVALALGAAQFLRR
jgi:membrane protease YdiL (CAAX protease family)